MKDDPIANSLGMVPLDGDFIPGNQNSEKTKPLIPTQVSDDFDHARANLYDVISQGHDSLNDLIEIAKQSQNPRAFEVVSTLMNSIVAANEKLLDIQKKKKELETEKSSGAKTINNTLVVTTAELQRMLKNNDSGE